MKISWAMLLEAAALVALLSPVALGDPIGRQSLGLTEQDGVLLRDGRPYRAIGANYFDLFARLLRNPQDTSHREGLARLAKAGVPFARFMACGFWPVDNDLYLQDKEAYFRRLDQVIEAAEQERIGLIPSLFWNIATAPDMAGEPLDQLGNPESKTIGFIRRRTAEIVSRYKHSPAIWGWELGNEYNLAADLPNAAKHRAAVWPKLKTAATRSERDEVKFVHLAVALRVFAETVRKLDPDRIIISGNSLPRASAYHNVLEHTWKQDTPEQFREILLRDNPDPIDTICVHLYPKETTGKNPYPAGAQSLDGMVELLRHAARQAKKPLFIGEFGAAAVLGKQQSQDAFAELLAAIEKHEVPLSAFWVYDFAAQDKQWNVTFDNDRAPFLEAVIQANRRIAGALETPAGGRFSAAPIGDR